MGERRRDVKVTMGETLPPPPTSKAPSAQRHYHTATMTSTTSGSKWGVESDNHIGGREVRVGVRVVSIRVRVITVVRVVRVRVRVRVRLGLLGLRLVLGLGLGVHYLGFQVGSKTMTTLADVRLRPSPPALVQIRSTNMVGPRLLP